MRYRLGHARKRAPDYTVDEASGCWIWSNGCANGYGEIRRGEFRGRAHRYVYERLRGPIPEGKCLHHICGTPRCVNPDHLVLVDRREHAGAVGHGKLTLEDAREIRRVVEAGERGIRMRVAREYGIGRSTVTAIMQGRIWREDGDGD